MLGQRSARALVNSGLRRGDAVARNFRRWSVYIPSIGILIARFFVKIDHEFEKTNRVASESSDYSTFTRSWFPSLKENHSQRHQAWQYSY
jgi:hypothetical protein